MKQADQSRKVLFLLISGALLLATGARAQSFPAIDAQANACYAQPAFSGHAIYLPGIDPAFPGIPVDGKFVFSPSPGSFVENNNGTAHLTGHVVSAAHSGVGGFDVDLTFTGRQSPPVNRVLELELACYDGNAVPGGTGNANPDTWHTYADFNGTLKGTGGYAGATLHVAPTMHNFQVGQGASGKNDDPGASGWFSWLVSGSPANGHTLVNSGASANSPYGDVNINLSSNDEGEDEDGDEVVDGENPDGENPDDEGTDEAADETPDEGTDEGADGGGGPGLELGLPSLPSLGGGLMHIQQSSGLNAAPPTSTTATSRQAAAGRRAQGQGQNLESRLANARSLVGQADRSTRPMLRGQLERLRAEAQAAGRLDLVQQANRLLASLSK